MAKSGLLLLLLLHVALAAPVAAVTADAAERAERLVEAATQRYNKTVEDFLETIDAMDSLPPGDGGFDCGKGPPSGVVDVFIAGGLSFNAAAVDITNSVTSTTQCGGGGDAASQRPVRCDDALCKRYGGRRQPSCGGAASVCSSAGPYTSPLPLRQGHVVVYATSSGRWRQQVFSRDTTVYSCRPGGAGDGDGAALIGLGRRSILAATFRRFTYVVDINLRSFVWLEHDDVDGNAAAPAAGPRWSGATPLVSDNDTYPDMYLVSFAGLNYSFDLVVHGGVVQMTGATSAAGMLAIWTTTMPFTFLHPHVYQFLEQMLPAAARVPSNLSARLGQRCYAAGTKLPSIGLIFAGGNVVMELQPAEYTYARRDGAVCMSILASRWPAGVSVIGSMVQAGRRVAYDLDAGTLAFQASAAPPSPAFVFRECLCVWASLLLAMIMSS